MDRDRDIRRYLPLRPVQFHVLLSLSGGQRHGYGMIQDAEERGESLDIGTLYRTLARMVEEGLIAAVPAPAREVDERRHYYAVTAKGERLARAEARRLAALTQAARQGGLLPEGAS